MPDVEHDRLRALEEPVEVPLEERRVARRGRAGPPRRRRRARSPESKTDTTARSRGTSSPLTQIRISSLRGSSAWSWVPVAMSPICQTSPSDRLDRRIHLLGRGDDAGAEAEVRLPVRRRARHDALLTELVHAVARRQALDVEAHDPGRDLRVRRRHHADALRDPASPSLSRVGLLDGALDGGRAADLLVEREAPGEAPSGARRRGTRRG